MESRAHFFALAPLCYPNSRYLNQLKLSDIFTLNNYPLFFLVLHGEPRYFIAPTLRACTELGHGSEPDLACNLCIFDQKAQWIVLDWRTFVVFSCKKAVFLTGHYVILICVFIHIVGSIFIFNIFLGEDHELTTERTEITEKSTACGGRVCWFVERLFSVLRDLCGLRGEIFPGLLPIATPC
jgi:hypothetical protein